jgi:hypothetical protein
MRLTVRILILAVALTLTAAGTALAQRITYSFPDPVGDQTGAIDVTELFLIFDFKGNYTLYLIADPAHPFVGQFRVNINLYNVDVDPAFAAFSRACTKKCGGFGGNTDFDLPNPITKLVIPGRDPVLTHWRAGDRAVTSSFSGLAPGLFRSGVDSFPLTFFTNEDCIECDPTGVAVGQRTFPRRGWILPVP